MILIQNADRNVSARDYNSIGDKLAVSTFFSTIQGEGPFAGHPAMFVRLAGCNYGSKTDGFCSFCDSSFHLDKATIASPQDLLQTVTEDVGYNEDQILVITGGEPTLQLNLLTFIVLAEPYFKDIQIETNGTQPKFFAEASARNMTHMFKTVVSPKANERTSKYPKVAPDVLWWANCLKFVVSADETSAHHTVPDWALESKKTIYVSPMAVYAKAYEGEVSSVWEDGLIDKEATARNYKYSAEYAMTNRLLVSVQTHLFLGLA